MAASDPNPASSVGKPTARLRAHVEQIAGGACILIHWTRGRRAHAVPALLEIEVPEIRGLVSYATALHELGHILGRYQTSRSTMTRERWAWA